MNQPIKKNAIITGGAGQIGHATATRLALEGYRIFSLVRRDLETAQKLVNSLPNNHLEHCAVLADVSNTNSVKNAVKIIKEKIQHCDILVNCAGISLPTDYPMDNTDEIFDAMMSVNLRGTWVIIRELMDLLNVTGNTLVVNMSSMASIQPRANSLTYSASKAGINAMTQSLAKAYAPRIRFVAIAPNRLIKGTSGRGATMSELACKEFSLAVPMKRIITAEEIADTIEHLAHRMTYYTGQVLILDGGMTL
jgi:3-oxoacyl-[acyl-carrier protein] reductase